MLKDQIEIEREKDKKKKDMLKEMAEIAKKNNE
jgi:hypothetical protein